MLQNFVQDSFSQDIASRLDKQLHSSVVFVFVMKQVQDGVQQFLTNGLEENLSACKNDPACPFSGIALFVWVCRVQIRVTFRQVLDNPGENLFRFTQNLEKPVSLIGPESILVTVCTSSVAKPRNDIVNRLHISTLSIHSTADGTA